MNCGMRARRLAVLCGAILTLTMVALLASGCRQNAGSQTASATRNGAAAGVRLITPIPFGELNGGEDYNASGVVPLGDSRFLFCDNHASDALYELDLTSDGQKQGKLIRRPLQGLADDSIADLEGMTLAEEAGGQFVFVASSLCLKKATQD